MGIIVDDEENYQPKRHKKGNFSSNVDSGMNIIYIVAIMGFVLLVALYFTNQPCPECNIPACPEINMTQFTCPDIPTCPTFTCPAVTCVNGNVTEKEYINLTESDCIGFVNKEVNLNMTMTLMNSTDYNDNVTYTMSKDSEGVYDTTELNATYLHEQIGDYWVIQTGV